MCVMCIQYMYRNDINEEKMVYSPINYMHVFTMIWQGCPINLKVYIKHTIDLTLISHGLMSEKLISHGLMSDKLLSPEIMSEKLLSHGLMSEKLILHGYVPKIWNFMAYINPKKIIFITLVTARSFARYYLKVMWIN